MLDAGFKKVVVFDSLGRVERIIGRGSGRGPGELVYPIAMAVSHDSIAVLDYSQNRVTVFDIDGQLLATVNTQRAKDIALVEGELWGAQMPGRIHMLLQRAIADGINASRDVLAVDACWGRTCWRARSTSPRAGFQFRRAKPTVSQGSRRRES